MYRMSLIYATDSSAFTFTFVPRRIAIANHVVLFFFFFAKATQSKINKEIKMIAQRAEKNTFSGCFLKLGIFFSFGCCCSTQSH